MEKVNIVEPQDAGLFSYLGLDVSLTEGAMEASFRKPLQLKAHRCCFAAPSRHLAINRAFGA